MDDFKMQDWATQSIRDSVQKDVATRKDFNGDVINLNDHVLFAQTRGQLGEGKVVDIATYPGAVTIQSLRYSNKTLTIDVAGVIKVAG